MQFAAGAPRPVPALPFRRRRPAGGWGKDRPSPTDLCDERRRSRWSLWRGLVWVTASSPLRRSAAYETVGWGRVGVPPQQTAHEAAMLQLTPHHAVCEEVPRRGPAPPPCRRNRESLQPGRRLRPVFDRHGRIGARPMTARPAIEAIFDRHGRDEAQQPTARPALEASGWCGQVRGRPRGGAPAGAREGEASSWGGSGGGGSGRGGGPWRCGGRCGRGGGGCRRPGRRSR